MRYQSMSLYNISFILFMNWIGWLIAQKDHIHSYVYFEWFDVKNKIKKII